jgi:hypothetical protein
MLVRTRVCVGVILSLLSHKFQFLVWKLSYLLIISLFMLHLLTVICKGHNVRISNVTTKLTKFEERDHTRTENMIEWEEIEQVK